jgi:ABC-type transporter Mla subunit MlaD
MTDDLSAGTRAPPLRAQEDTLSANFTRTTATASHSMSQAEPPLVRELRQIIAELQRENATYERQIKELRGAIVALMEPGMPRILRTPGGIMVLDKKQ